MHIDDSLFELIKSANKITVINDETGESLDITEMLKVVVEKIQE